MSTYTKTITIYGAGHYSKEKNITEVAYYHNHMGHNGVCSQLVFPMVRGAQGGVGLVVRELPEGWGIK